MKRERVILPVYSTESVMSPDVTQTRRNVTKIGVVSTPLQHAVVRNLVLARGKQTILWVSTDLTRKRIVNLAVNRGEYL